MLACVHDCSLATVFLSCVRYLRQAFSSLAHLYDSLSQALGGSWEGDVVLTPGLRALEKVRNAKHLPDLVTCLLRRMIQGGLNTDSDE